MSVWLSQTDDPTDPEAKKKNEGKERCAVLTSVLPSNPLLSQVPQEEERLTLRTVNCLDSGQNGPFKRPTNPGTVQCDQSNTDLYASGSLDNKCEDNDNYILHVLHYTEIA